MQYLFVILLFVVSSLNAGVYAGAGLALKQITGTYYEVDSFTKNSYRFQQSEEDVVKKNSWDIKQDVIGGTLIAGYGFEDSLSAEGNFILFTEGYAVGANLQYGLDLGLNAFYPHILVGGAYTDLSGGTITVFNDNRTDSDIVNNFPGPETVSLKVGVGASFIVTDNIVIYSDIMIFLQEVQYSTYDESTYDDYDGSGTITRTSEYDSLMYGIRVGVRFYMSGATSKRYNLAVEAENQRQQEIDDYIN